MFEKGDKVQDVYTNDVFIVKRSDWQDYAGQRDQTVEFEPAMHMGQWQATPWNKGSNLKLISRSIPYPVNLNQPIRSRENGRLHSNC